MVEKLFKVGGSANIGGDLRAGEVRVGGSIEAKAIYAEIFKLGGRASIEKVEAKHVEIDRNSEVRGLVFGCRVVVGKGAEVKGVIGHDVVVEKDAEVDRVEALKVKVEKGAGVDELYYVQEAQVDRDAKVSKAIKVDKLSVELKCEEL